MAKIKRPKRLKKVVVAPVIDPGVEPSETAVIHALEALQASVGWAVIVKNLKGNIDALAGMIIAKKDQNGDPISDEECDKLRYRREFLIDFGETPATIVNGLKEGNIEIPKDDPYPQDARELEQMKNGA